MEPYFFKPDACHPLAGVEPIISHDDLAILNSIVEGAKVVGLGEPTHGQKGINQLRDRMTRYLVEAEGFRVVAMEDSAIKCRLVNDFIMHGRGSAEMALKQQNFWTWRTKEVLTMIEWLREWNLTHPDDKVRFIGVDIQDLTTPGSELFGVLVRIDRETATSFKPAFSRIGQIELWSDTQPFGDAEYAEYMSVLREIKELLTDSPKILEEERQLGLDCVLALQQALRLRREIVASRGEQTATRWNRRENAMAARTLAPTEEGERVILWAHNGHVQSEQMDGLPYGAETIGQVLRANLSNEYRAISGIFGSGEYRGYDGATGSLGTLDVGDPPEGSLDHELWSRFASTALVVDLTEPGSILFEPQTSRWAGALLLESDDMLATVRPGFGSDAIAFVRETTPSEPI